MIIRPPEPGKSHASYAKAGFIAAATAACMLAGQDSGGMKHAEHGRVSFEQAVSTPELRQEYLDQRMKEWGITCAAALVYDPTDTLVFQEIRSRRRFYLRNRDVAPLLFGSSDESGEAQPTNIAFTATYFLDLVGGHKPSIYVRPMMFDFVSNNDANDELVEQILAIHEERHACEAYKGLEIRGRRFTYGELTEMSGVLHYVQEIRAYGTEIDRRGLTRGDFYERSMVGNFVEYFDIALLTELDSSGAWKSFEYRIPSRAQAMERLRAVGKDDDGAPLFALRMTALDHWKQMEEIAARGLDDTKLEGQAWLDHDSHKLHLSVLLRARLIEMGRTELF